jgi:hypothetical protein
VGRSARGVIVEVQVIMESESEMKEDERRRQDQRRLGPLIKNLYSPSSKLSKFFSRYVFAL